MKKIIALIICIAGILPALSFGQLTFSNQVITVEPSQLSVESVEFQASEVVTNTVTEWVTTNVVYQGGALENYATETNTVRQQVSHEEVIITADKWICNVVFSLPKGHPWALNGFNVSVERFKVDLQVPVNPATVTAAFGPASAGLEFAAQNGAYQPTGQVRDAFLSFAAAVLAAGQ